MATIFISKRKFEELKNNVSDYTIKKYGLVKDLPIIDCIQYAITGHDVQNNVELLKGYEAVPYNAYAGTIEPLSFHEHHEQVALGKRRNTWSGMVVLHNRAKYVLTGTIVYFKMLQEKYVQPTLF